MDQTYISIPISIFKTLSAEAQKVILSGTSVEAVETRSATAAEEEGPVELTTAMARKLITGLSEKTTLVLRRIAESPTPEFKLSELITAVPDATHNGDLRGVWSAITRRSRTVCDDASADLMWWKDDAKQNAEGELIDQTGYVSDLTHSSLRKALGL